jgi:hypothetical protein
LRRPVLLLLSLSAVACAGGSVRDGTQLPVGRLGRPLGAFLQIEGARLDGGKVGKRTLLVDRVGTSALSPPISISLENLDLPSGVRCRISGYETGRWIGVPPEVRRAEGLAPGQAEWQFYRSFVVTSVQAPDSLVEDFRGSPGAG